MLFDATRRKLEARTDEDRPALQSAADNWPTSLTQQPRSDASSGTGISPNALLTRGIREITLEDQQMKIEGLTIEVILKPGTDEFDQLAKQFAESAYRHLVELWRQGTEQQPAATYPQFLATE
ncbi:hypothetical protein P7C00_11255 [Pseudomonas sp. JDS08PS003]|uniref:hypothetical protein n=1 Tax=Pseudomonas sp. JDS08PS003 TaxID=2497162 RepID=UPI003857D111